MTTNIIYTKKKGIARIIINRPEAQNALDQQTRLEIRKALDDIENDKEKVKVAIITGAGSESFASGGDIKQLKQLTATTMLERTDTLGQRLLNDIENSRIPFIAMINGYCLGGGCELAMSCDIRIASENAKFGHPEINIGLFPGGGGTQRLPRLVGWGRAKELIYTGRIIDATEAEKIGLINKVVPPDKLESTVNVLAEDIASKSSIIMNLAKKTINRGMYTDLAAGLAYERSNFSLCFVTKDYTEGVNAFLEKRKPEFKGE